MPEKLYFLISEYGFLSGGFIFRENKVRDNVALYLAIDIGICEYFVQKVLDVSFGVESSINIIDYALQITQFECVNVYHLYIAKMFVCRLIHFLPLIGQLCECWLQCFISNPREDRKWRGVARFYVPTDDGSDSDEYTKSVLRSVTDALEASNKGYVWDWDESKLKGLKVGILVRDKEYEIDGRHGFAPEIFRFIGIDRIQSGRFTVPKPKLIKRDNAPASQTAAPAYSPEVQKSIDNAYPF